MVTDYFEKLDAWQRANLLHLFDGIEDALDGRYPDGLSDAISEYAALPEEERLAAYRAIKDPAQGKLDEVLPVLTDDQAQTVPDAFPTWAVGVAYEAGARVKWGEATLYRCVQAHTSQEDWTPDAVPALWTRIGDPGEEWPEWVQPTGAHDAYAKGDKVSHGGKHWTSDVDGNVWEPGVYGWTEV